MKQILSMSYCLVCSWLSLGKYWANPRAPLEWGMIVTFNKGDAPSKNQDTTAWPLSWTATIFLYSSDNISKALLGILAPTSLYFLGFLRISTNYCISSLLCSIPATSLNLVVTFLTISYFLFAMSTPPPSTRLTNAVTHHIRIDHEHQKNKTHP